MSNYLPSADSGLDLNIYGTTFMRWQRFRLRILVCLSQWHATMRQLSRVNHCWRDKFLLSRPRSRIQNSQRYWRHQLSSTYINHVRDLDSWKLTVFSTTMRKIEYNQPKSVSTEIFDLRNVVKVKKFLSRTRTLPIAITLYMVCNKLAKQFADLRHPVSRAPPMRRKKVRLEVNREGLYIYIWVVLRAIRAGDASRHRPHANLHTQ